MVLLQEFKRAVLAINRDKLSSIFLFIQFVYFSGLVRQFGTDYFLVGNIILTTFLCFYTKKVTDQDFKSTFVILFVFLIINTIPLLFHGLDARLFLGYSGRILLGIYIVVFLKHKFFRVFENLVFALAFISIPLFILQLVNVGVFEILRGLSEFTLSDERLNFGRGELDGHRYMLIFLVNSWAEYRNSGFMWEPAAFGAMLSWAIVFNMYINNFEHNPRLVIYFIAGLTTFSIGTYIYILLFLFLFIAYHFRVIRAFYFLGLIVIIFYLLSFFQLFQDNFEMMTNKIEHEGAQAEVIRAGQAPERVSRYGGFVANFKNIFDEPFGYGVNEDIEIRHGGVIAPNGLMKMVRNWGVFAYIILLISSYKLLMVLRYFYPINLKPFHIGVLMLLILMPISGNPFYNQPFLYSIILSGYIVKKPQIIIK